MNSSMVSRHNALLPTKAMTSIDLIDQIVETQAAVVIPPKRNRKNQRSYDAELYQERNIVERALR